MQYYSYQLCIFLAIVVDIIEMPSIFIIHFRLFSIRICCVCTENCVHCVYFKMRPLALILRNNVLNCILTLLCCLTAISRSNATFLPDAKSFDNQHEFYTTKNVECIRHFDMTHLNAVVFIYIDRTKHGQVYKLGNIRSEGLFQLHRYC